MTDVATTWSVDHGDWTLAGADLQTGDDLVTAVVISLFTDGQAAPDDALPPGSTDPRGWWGDLGAGKPIGSRLWLWARAKQTAQTLAGVRGAMVTALQWLIDDGVAAGIDVVCQYIAPGQLGAAITVRRTGGGRTAMNFQWAWAGMS